MCLKRLKPPLLRVCCLNCGRLAHFTMKAILGLSLQWSHIARHGISVARRCSGCRAGLVGCLRQRRTLCFCHFRRWCGVATGTSLPPLGAVRLGCLRCRLLRRSQRGTGRSLRALGGGSAACAGTFPSWSGVTLLQTLDTTHLSSGQVGLDARGFTFKVDFKVVSAQGIAKCLICAAIKGLVPRHPWAPTLFQLNHPVVVSLIALGTGCGQEVAGGQIAIRLGGICWHLRAHFDLGDLGDLAGFNLDLFLVDAVHVFVNTKVGH